MSRAALALDRDQYALPGWPRGLSIDLAAAYVGLSNTTFLRLEDLPSMVRITPGRVIWLREDLDAWLDRKAGRATRAPRPEEMA